MLQTSNKYLMSVLLILFILMLIIDSATSDNHRETLRQGVIELFNERYRKFLYI